MIVILGPTATGKTAIATPLAAKIDAEIISADSRQVFRGMDIGTGKDLADYNFEGKKIPYHLIDIAEPGSVYSVYNFQNDFLEAYKNISSRKKTAILCGGTGLYLESVISGYRLAQVPDNETLREELSKLSDESLISRLKSYKKTHNKTDTNDRKRLIRAIEIEEYYLKNPKAGTEFPKIPCDIFGINYDRQIVRKRITERLDSRLKEGMIEEVKGLLDKGVSHEKLRFYGLEYRFITEYLCDELSYNEMFKLLNTAIHQFSKRQMTWFRRMEKKGININWIPPQLDSEKKIDFILSNLQESSKSALPIG